jgi:hypothetical protein
LQDKIQIAMFNKEDETLLESKGISINEIEKQLDSFKKGFPYLEIQASATPGNGIKVFSAEETDVLIRVWDDYMLNGGKVIKFVPASGAASRMFKDLFEFLNSTSELPENGFMKYFFDNIMNFAFYGELDETCLKNEGKTISQLVSENKYKAVVSNLLQPEGLNYGSLPKGLLQFHKYDDGARKSVEEHLVEGALYAKENDGSVNVHFTVSTEHRQLFEEQIKVSTPVIEQKYGVKLFISFSEQKPSTDTIAATSDNQPFRDNGKLVFRPGGHGALIENLNDLDSEVVFIKNIDNIVPDCMKPTTVRYKKLIAGLLISLKEKTFNYLESLEKGSYDHELLVEIVRFLQHDLNTRNPETKLLEDSELALYLKHKLNRPIRVCGMVKNQGEPGGGPFWTFNQDGTYSLQILESSQIDLKDPDKKTMFEQGTHFNPVDLVCYIKDNKGNKFNLPDYVDKQTGFISIKSKNGNELKALELPGLWNGAMSDWNTAFVEVPIETFNPVKTVNDLLRKEHQQA